MSANTNLETIIKEFNTDGKGASAAVKHLSDLYSSENSVSFSADLKALNEQVDMKKLGFPDSCTGLRSSAARIEIIGHFWRKLIETINGGWCTLIETERKLIETDAN